MSTQIPEETLKQWREEFEKNIFSPRDRERLYDDPDQYRFRDIQNQWLGYLSAKTSSYEREQGLERELYQQRFNNKHNFSIDQKVSDEIQKLQERITQLEKFCNEFVYGEENPEYYKTMDEKIAKRDQLIEQARPWAIEVFNLEMEDFDLKEKIDQWLKQIEELKGEK